MLQMPLISLPLPVIRPWTGLPSPSVQPVGLFPDEQPEVIKVDQTEGLSADVLDKRVRALQDT